MTMMEPLKSIQSSYEAILKISLGDRKNNFQDRERINFILQLNQKFNILFQTTRIFNGQKS